MKPYTELRPNGTFFKSWVGASGSRNAIEVYGYLTLPDFTPRLLDYGPGWHIVEACTPLLEVGGNVRYAKPLWDLLQALHDAGYWHRDIDLSNVVVDADDRVRLVDLEWLTQAQGSVSYDLFGHVAAGVVPAWGDDSVWWGNGGPRIPGRYWDG